MRKSWTAYWFLTINIYMNAFCPSKSGNLTVDDYLKTPDGPPWYELVDGQILKEPSPTISHQIISRELVGRPLQLLFT